MPAITGDTDANAWWGVGYAVAQDRLFQLELFRRATSGRLAEILGSTYLDDDLIARRDYYTDAEIDEMLAKIPAPLMARTEAYRDGINAWIEHVSSPGFPDMPGEFVALSDLPIEPWTVRDTARIGVFLARTVPSSNGREFDNAADLGALGGADFNQLLPVQSKKPRLTIAASEGRFPSDPGRTRAEERRGFKRSQKYLRATDLSGVSDTATQIPVETQTAGAPGAGLDRDPPARRLVHVGDRRPRERSRLPLQRAAARVLDPGAVRRVRAALADPARSARSQRRRNPARRDRPQRPPRLGIHVGPVRQRRPLRRQAHRRQTPTSSAARSESWSAETRSSPTTRRPPTCPT